MGEWKQTGIEEWGELLHLPVHRIRSGELAIRVVAARRPTCAGIDPLGC